MDMRQILQAAAVRGVLIRQGAPASACAVERAERQIGCALPGEYRTFLLTVSNGANLRYEEGDSDVTGVQLYGVSDDPARDIASITTSLRESLGLRRRQVVIACAPNGSGQFLAIDERGAVRDCYGERHPVIAPTFAAFVERVTVAEDTPYYWMAR